MTTDSHYLEELNPAQRAAVEHGVADGPRAAPLLVIAGAGTGKTKTLACRVAHLIRHGADPRRMLLLTFSRRAAREMTRRARQVLATAGCRPGAAEDLLWSGTFHSVANRLLRRHAAALGLPPSFTVLDRADAADLLNLLRDELGLSRRPARFPQKATCLAIYSHTVNSRQALERTVTEMFPWCANWLPDLRTLFGSYAEHKHRQQVLDYDDLLLYWHHLMSEPALAAAVRGGFDHVLVDEYQDTNGLQADILRALKPDGAGVTVVGDDAQAIYSFRAATVRNILDFPSQFHPPATVVTLAHNYRSSDAILDACNAVIRLAPQRFTKDLYSGRPSAQRPLLVTVEDEAAQADYVANRIIENREAGLQLRRQAVLFRTAHHSDHLEVELRRRNIPFVKYGGLKFLEAAHVKDVLCVLRWAENPRDAVAAFRVLQILPGIGPAHARRAIEHLAAHDGDFAALHRCVVPPLAADDWPALIALLVNLRRTAPGWPEEWAHVRAWYAPHLERRDEAAAVRRQDVEHLGHIAATYPSRERFLTELTLDPPDASGDEAGPPHRDEDYLILSTIHSAKGREWNAVYVLNVADGCIPSDMATDTAEQIEEERRLLYVAMTRAREQLHLVHPHRFFTREQPRFGDRHIYAPRTRFIPETILARFESRAYGHPRDAGAAPAEVDTARVDVAGRLRTMWRS